MHAPCMLSPGWHYTTSTATCMGHTPHHTHMVAHNIGQALHITAYPPTPRVPTQIICGLVAPPNPSTQLPHPQHWIPHQRGQRRPSRRLQCCCPRGRNTEVDGRGSSSPPPAAQPVPRVPRSAIGPRRRCIPPFAPHSIGLRQPKLQRSHATEGHQQFGVQYRRSAEVQADGHQPPAEPGPCMCPLTSARTC